VEFDCFVVPAGASPRDFVFPGGCGILIPFSKFSSYKHTGFVITQEHISAATPMGANLVGDGATFKTWAPRATAVYLLGPFNNWSVSNKWKLAPRDGGHWAGFAKHVSANTEYLFHVEGAGGKHDKRDPYARELTLHPAFPSCRCIVKNPGAFPWHDRDFIPPEWRDLIIYQLHVGTFSISANQFAGKFLNVIEKIPYLAALGVTAIEPLPIDEFPTEFSLGYNGTDYFSPEGDYAVGDETVLEAHRASINQILQDKGISSIYSKENLTGPANQLKALIDVCHVYGIAVILDLVYNHAGGGFDENSLYFFDEHIRGDNNNSLYFTDQGWAGGLVFAYWNKEVREYLIRNSIYYLQECHVDGFRFDEVSVIDRFGGWHFCQELTDRLRATKPSAIAIAEYWPVNDYVIRNAADQGAGFDATWHDGLRGAIRTVIGQAAAGAGAFVDFDSLANSLQIPFGNGWRAVQHVENHDIIKLGEQPRIPQLADRSNPRSWHARSRSRVATGLLLTAPGIPLLFMGQEFLEDKQWSDNPQGSTLIWWGGLDQDKAMVDHLRFTQDLVQLRRRQPALCSDRIHVFHQHNVNRVLAFHRWIEGQGRDVVVVVSLSESTYWEYWLGFPRGGHWFENFNSDVYDNWVNPLVAGNGESIEANGSGMHGFEHSARIVIPANSILVFGVEP